MARAATHLPCPVGWQCAAANLTTGGQSSQCVPNSGACQCSAAASAQQLVSWCSGGDVGCAGTRTCTVNGLGPCLSGTPSEEVCNGADDDCDGIKDEDACDDNNECTQDTCNGTSGCTYTPLNAGSCGGICVTNGVCVNGECTGANALDCDDGDPCTTDTCDPVLGCQNTPVVGPCNPSDDCVPGTSECAPGEQDVETQACGACGSQTRTRTCSDQCAWGEWSDWSACSSESVCSPGETEQETQACGDCGSQVRTRSCTNACDWTAWSSWSSCSGAGICSPGQVETQNQSCGNCGSQSRTRSCTAQCAWNSWGSWSGCNGQGACSPGQVETQNQSCGNCGSQSRTRSCNSGCGWNSWSSWGSCDSQGACAPGEVSDSGCDACAQKTCSNSCEWSQCNLKPGAQCLWESGANWQCCGAGKWQFCLGPNYGCIWSNQCEACSGCGC